MRATHIVALLTLVCCAGRARAQDGGAPRADVADAGANDAGEGAPPQVDEGVGEDAGVDVDAGVAVDVGQAPEEAPGDLGAAPLEQDGETEGLLAPVPEEESERPEVTRAVAIRYFFERVAVAGNTTTSAAVIRGFTTFERGDVLDIDDPELEALRWKLLGTGWFEDVRLALRRGSRRGWVVLVIHVEERNTLVVQHVAAGVAEGIQRTTDLSPDLTPYVSVSVAETNLLGLGMGVSLAVLASVPQQGVRLRFSEPFLFGSDYSFSSALFANNAREFFGDDTTRVSIVCPPPDPDDVDDVCPPEVIARNAVVFYKRYGASLGIGHDIGGSTRYTLDWQGEIVDVGVRPEAASEMRGDAVQPIDFSIDDGVSFVSVARVGLVFDRRDDPGLTSQGTLVQFRGDLASRLIGSDYSFVRLQVLAQHWFRVFGDHSIRLGVFAGSVFGRAPFFYKFYASDLSDLIPSRVLEMNIDRRAPPDLFGTSIAVMRAEEFGARVDIEYALPLYRRGSGLRAIDAYAQVGLYTLSDVADFNVAVSGYHGLSKIPVDLTFDLGLRLDTSVGLFQLGFSNLLGFITP